MIGSFSLHDPALLCMLLSGAVELRIMEACRGEKEEAGTPAGPGSVLLDKGSVQRLASRLNERIAGEEQSGSPASRLSLSPSPLVRLSCARPLVVLEYSPVSAASNAHPARVVSCRPLLGLITVMSVCALQAQTILLASSICATWMGGICCHAQEYTGLSASMRCTRRPVCMRRSWSRTRASSCSARRAQTRPTGCALTSLRLSRPIEMVHITMPPIFGWG